MKIDLHYSNNPPFTNDDYEQKGLGGTEGFIVQVARELAWGHDVRVYNRSPIEMPSGGAFWTNISRFNPQEDRDILISFRMREIFEEDPKGYKIIILADTESEGLGDLVRAGKVDLVMFVSQWQKDKIAAEEGIPDENCMVASNGVRLSEFVNNEIEKVPGMCIHTSTPERGLTQLLELWPKIQIFHADATLQLFSSYIGWGVSPEQNLSMAGPQYAQAEYLAKTGHNVVNHIHANDELREWQLKSQLFLYPTKFLETCCLHGDTIVNMPCDHRYGQGVPIKYLIDEKDFPVYTYNEERHRFTLGTAKKVWKSRENAETVQLVFEEGTELTLTPDHLVYTFDGEWIQAGNLKEGDRLTGLNYRYNVNVNIGDGRETSEARLVGEWMTGKKIEKGKHAHHWDEEGLDNSPWMIDILPAGVHHRITHKGKVMHPTVTRIAREGFSKWAQTEEGQQYLSTRNTESVKKMWEKMRSLPEDEFLRWLKMRGYHLSRNYRDKRDQMTKEELAELHERYSEMGAKGSRKAWNMIYSWPIEKQQRYFHERSIKAYTSRYKNVLGAFNHVIKSIARGPIDDVYDMEVEPYHNFVAGGVVVHNCISALEAAAAGCVLVCSDVAALHERVIDGVTGYLIPGEVGTPDHDWLFISKVNELLMHPEKLNEMGLAAKEYAKVYDYSTMIGPWVEEWTRKF